MMRKWAKWLPYKVIVWYVKKFTADLVDVAGMRCKMWRIDYGEFILVDIQSELQQQKKKLEAKLREINEKLGVDE